MRRISTINETKIKYLLVVDKIYEVTSINWLHFALEASETDLKVDDVPEKEVFDITDFKDFKVTLRNWHGNVVDFADFVKNRKNES